MDRKRKKVRNSVSLREFFEMVEEMLPGEDDLHKKLDEMKHPPMSLKTAVSMFTEADERSAGIFRTKLLEHAEVLTKAALRVKAKKGRWWKSKGDEERKRENTRRKKKSDGINAMEEVQDPAVQVLTQAMTQMAERQKTFREDLKAEVFAMVTGKEEEAKKEKGELEWEAKAKEQAE